MPRVSGPHRPGVNRGTGVFKSRPQIPGKIPAGIWGLTYNFSRHYREPNARCTVATARLLYHKLLCITTRLAEDAEEEYHKFSPKKKGKSRMTWWHPTRGVLTKVIAWWAEASLRNPEIPRVLRPSSPRGKPWHWGLTEPPTDPGIRSQLGSGVLLEYPIVERTVAHAN